MSNTAKTIQVDSSVPNLVADPNLDKQVVFQLLSKFDLSAGDVAQLFAAYLEIHRPKEDDLTSLRSALKRRGTEAQNRILEAAGDLLTSEEIAARLGYSSRQTAHNKKVKRQLLALSLPNRKGDFFPAFQLDGSAIRAWIPELLQRIPESWSALSFLTARREQLNGESFLNVVLRDPSKVRDMIEAADDYAS